MSNILIIESIGRPIEEDFSKTSVAHARNAVTLAKELGADLITGDRDKHIAQGKKYDHIICSYASPYMKYKDLISFAYDNPDAKLWWLVNDHDLEDNILLRNVIKSTNGERKINMICNNGRDGYRGWILRKRMKGADGQYIGILDDFIVEWHTVNLNALLYQYEHPYSWDEKSRQCIYYGTMRKWRLDDLIMYQQTGMDFSCTPRTQKKYQEKGVTEVRFLDKLIWMRGAEELPKYRFSLYVEDEHTHANFAFMANRYYESLAYGVVTLFDVKCVETIRKSGFVVPDICVIDGIESYWRAVRALSTREAYMKVLEADDINRAQARQQREDLVGYLKRILLDGDIPAEALKPRMDTEEDKKARIKTPMTATVVERLEVEEPVAEEERYCRTCCWRSIGITKSGCVMKCGRTSERTEADSTCDGWDSDGGEEK